jgi:hypothetical protein
VLILYFGLREQLQAHPMPFELPALAPLFALSVVPADLLMKVFWRRSPVEMDDYLRTRPVSQLDWSRFILVDTATGLLQWALPVMMAFVAGLILPWWAALLTFVLAYSCSVVNALFQNCWRRAPGNQWTLPLVFAYLAWLLVASGVTILCFVVLGLAGDDPSTPVSASSTTRSPVSSPRPTTSTPARPSPSPRTSRPSPAPSTRASTTACSSSRPRAT